MSNARKVEVVAWALAGLCAAAFVMSIFFLFGKGIGVLPGRV